MAVFAVVIALFVGALVALVVLQWRLVFLINRTLNPALLGATVLTLGAAVLVRFRVARRDGVYRDRPA